MEIRDDLQFVNTVKILLDVQNDNNLKAWFRKIDDSFRQGFEYAIELLQETYIHDVFLKWFNNKYYDLALEYVTDNLKDEDYEPTYDELETWAYDKFFLKFADNSTHIVYNSLLINDINNAI